MPDITMCPGDGCKIKKKCYRFMAKPSERQSFAYFNKGTEPCEDFISVEIFSEVNKSVICKNKKCRKHFDPEYPWQKYCPRCEMALDDMRKGEK